MELINNNQVPEGYKKTEVGVIPEDWEVDQLRNITQPKRPISYGIVQTGKPVLNGVKCIRVVDIINGKIADENLITTSEKISRYYKRTILLSKDLVIALRGKIGELAVISKELEGTNLTRGVALIALKDNHLSSFYHQYLSSLDSKVRLESSLNGSALQELPIATLRSFRVAIPPLPEQKAIAQTLSDVDALIAALDKLIAKKRNIKTATMQQLLTGKTRLPGFGEGKGYKKSALGMIPEDWEEKTYEDIFLFLKTASNSRADLSLNEDIKYIHYGDIHTKWQHKIDLQSELLPSISQEKVKSIPFLEEGDIVMADASEDYEGIGKSIEVVNIGNTKVVAGLHTFLLRDSKKTFVNGFRGYLHTIKSVKLSIDKMATGLKVYGLSKNSLKNIYVLIPDKEEQKAIASILSDMDSEIAALEKRRAKTQAIKQGMMQELLTGRTRLI